VAEEIIEITIRPDGKVEMHVTGVPGMDCVERTEELSQLPGGEVEAQELTAEAYQDVTATEQAQVRLELD
jgi:hypothetical protein